MTTKYKILFMVEVLNKYYGDLKCTDFKIVPSAATALLLRNHQMVYKMVGNQLVVLIKVKVKAFDGDTEEDKPFIPIDQKSKFLFYLDLQNPIFTAVTNLDTDKLRNRQRFYFSNTNANKVGMVLNLSKKIASFPTLQPYVPGDLVDDGTGTIFECIQSTGGGNAPSNTHFWCKYETAQLVSSQDMLTVVQRVSRYKTNAPATSFSIKVFGYNTTNGLFDREYAIKNNQVTTGKEPVDEISVDLSELVPGRYKVNINTTVYDVWVDDDMVKHSFFGVIELYPQLPSPSDFDFFDSQGKVKDIQVGDTSQWLKYTILYGSRLAYWKYIPKNRKVTAITDVDITGIGTVSFLSTPAVGTPKEYFTSSKPVPLRQIPWLLSVQLDPAPVSEPPALPNPNPIQSGTFSRTETKDYYCTIYLNY